LVNVASKRGGHNIYLLDGVKVTDEHFNNLVINLSVDSIQEFKIQKKLRLRHAGLYNSSMISGTKKYFERLGGIVQGKKKTYQLDVKERAPKRGEDPLYRYFEVVVTDDASGAHVKTDTFKAKPEDKNSDLETFVNGTKHSASNDFI
jgi:hypothetical protein